MLNDLTPIIAISNSVFFDYDYDSNLVLQKGFGAIFYSFNLKDNMSLYKEKALNDLEIITKSNLDIRYHCPFFSSVELAHGNQDKAERSLNILKQCIDIVHNFGGKFITVHIGLGWGTMEQLSFHRAIANLSDLVEYGAKRDVTVNLENLPNGWTSDPKTFMKLIEKTGASATIDLGHINASPWITENAGSNVDFLKIMAPHIVEAHVYEIERIDKKTSLPYHVAPQNLTVLRPLLQELRKTECYWWLIELNDKLELENTRKLLQSFLG